MTEEIVSCKQCRALMEFRKSSEKLLDDGVLHIVDEYICRTCNTTEYKDCGIEQLTNNPVYPLDISNARARSV